MKLSLLFFSILASCVLEAKEKICHKCEEIRKYNAEHHHNFEYFEDYLLFQEEQARKEAQQEQTITEDTADEETAIHEE